MLGFRLKEGLDLEAVASRYGRTAVRLIEEGIAEGLARGWVIHERKRSGSSGGGVGGGEGSDMDVGGIGGDGSRGGTGRAEAGGGGEEEKVQDGDGDGDGGGRRGRRRPPSSVSGSRGEGLGTLRLSDPDGFLFSNSVISSVFCELDGWERGEEDQGEGAGAAR